MTHLLQTVLALSLSGTLVAAVLALLRRLTRKRIPAGWYYYLWLLVLLRFVLPIPGFLPVPAESNTIGATERIGTTTVNTADSRIPRTSRPLPIIGPGMGGETVTPTTPPVFQTDNTNEVFPKQTQQPVTSDVQPEFTPSMRFIRTWDFWSRVWAFGAVVSGAWFLSDYFRFRRKLRRILLPAAATDLAALNRLHQRPYPKLYRAFGLPTPMLFGLWRPVIILPDRDYTPDMLDGILRHELTHFRRGDLLYKWFTMAVSCVHWFNPIFPLLRREIDRACELSCDERLLREMNREQKQQYGELLLTLAAERPLPRKVVAVSFATEKRNLKERLVQIMNFGKNTKTGIAALIAVAVLLGGCATIFGPGASFTTEREPVAADTNIRTYDVKPYEVMPTSAPRPDNMDSREYTDVELISVSTVDEFLAALGSNRTIALEPGEYNLSEASDYGHDLIDSEFYYWEEINDGYELKITDVSNLSIVGASAEETSIVTEPRYADVLSFCQGTDVHVAELTVGHTIEPGYCTGGVLDFNDSRYIAVESCVLYGCGTIGIRAVNCRTLIANNTVIKECSYGAVEADGSYDIRLFNSQIHDCGLKESFNAFQLFYVTNTTGFVVYNSEIYDNDTDMLLFSHSSLNVEMRGCIVHGNQFEHGVFRITGTSPVVDGCDLSDNANVRGLWYTNYDGENNSGVIGSDGQKLTGTDLEAMTYEPYTAAYGGPELPEVAAPPEGTMNENGEMEYHVTTVDEFLAAIGNDTYIYLDADTFDLSDATNYGGYGGNYYYWYDLYDGPGLIISGVSNLHIIGQGQDETTILAHPRYAEVLSFADCRDISVENLTAGHVQGSSCAGDVLEFQRCAGVWIEGCGLFGCGVIGINAYRSENITVKDTEIYECSSYGASFIRCSGVAFEGCTIRDCELNTIYVANSGTVTWDGNPRAEILTIIEEPGAVTPEITAEPVNP